MLSLNAAAFVNAGVFSAKNKVVVENILRDKKEQCFSYFHNNLKKAPLCKECPSSGLLCILEVFPLWTQLLWMLFMVLL